MAASQSSRRRKHPHSCLLLALFPLGLHARGLSRGASGTAGAVGNGGSGAGFATSILGSLTPISDLSAGAAAEQAALAAATNRTLGGRVFRCADISIGRTGSDTPDAGDGFARLDPALPDFQAKLAYTASLRDGGVVSWNASQLSGANVFLLQYISNVAGSFDFSYETVHLPDDLFFGGNRTAQLDHLFNTLRYDCLLSSTIVRRDRELLAEFLMPNEQFGYTVVTTTTPVTQLPILSLLFAWTQPFDRQIWITIIASLLFSSGLMYLLEDAHSEETDDFGAADLHLLLRISRGFYNAFLNFTANGGFNPSSPPGQLFNMAFTFVCLLIQATYTANLAAYFTRTAAPVTPVSDITSFLANSLPCCVPDDPYIYSMLASAFPLTNFVNISSMLAFDILDAILNGTCAGGILPDMDLRYALGPGDLTGQYCSIVPVAGLLTQGYYAIPFNRATVNLTAINALSALAASAYAYGDYAVGASQVYFTQNRPLCVLPLPVAGLGLYALQLRQVAGIFFILLFGFGASCISYASFKALPSPTLSEAAVALAARHAEQRRQLEAAQAMEREALAAAEQALTASVRSGLPLKAAPAPAVKVAPPVPQRRPSPVRDDGALRGRPRVHGSQHMSGRTERSTEQPRRARSEVPQPAGRQELPPLSVAVPVDHSNFMDVFLSTLMPKPAIPSPPQRAQSASRPRIPRMLDD